MDSKPIVRSSRPSFESSSPSEADRITRLPPFRSLLEAALDPMAILDPDGTIRWANEAWLRFEISRDRRTPGAGDPGVEGMIPPVDSPRLRESLASMQAGNRIFRHTYEAPTTTARRWVETTFAAVPDAPGWILLSLRDVTGLVVAEEAARHTLHHDEATGLPNRHYLERYAERSFERADRLGHDVAIFRVDLDRLEPLPETSDAVAEDLAVSGVVPRLRAACRAGDVLGRIGTRDLALLAEGLDRKEARSLCERIRLVLEDPIEFPEGTVRIDAAVGFALYPTHGPDFPSVLREAEEAADADRQRRNLDLAVSA